MISRNSRHKIVDGLVCKQCGSVYSAREQRVRQGLAIFCSRNCANLWKANKTEKRYVGKENGKVTFDKSKQVYYVYWYDPDTLQRKTTTYARWWWELNRGEIPDKYRASYREGNPLNIDPDNIILVSPEDFGKTVSDRLMGHSHSLDTRQKISVAHHGSKYWNGFAEYSNYPNFSKQLKIKVKERDNYTCQVCKSVLIDFPNRCRIHHIDGNKENSVIDNLVLVCVSCHSLIHSRKDSNNSSILSFRSKL